MLPGGQDYVVHAAGLSETRCDRVRIDCMTTAFDRERPRSGPAATVLAR
ncbi:hypothetical protein YT1_1933 [Rhodococcus ruber]|nr:hypothetical protein YT1_1933 [Rhodococcus ruber]